jgi:uncharacterized membrane protein
MITRLVSLLCVLTLGGLLVGCGADASDSGSADSGSAGSGAADSRSAGSRAADSGSAGSGAAGSGAAGSGADSPAGPGGGAKAGSVSESRLRADPATARANPAAPVTRLVRTAEVTLEVRNVSSAAEAVRTTAVSLGGIVGSEKTGYPDSGEDDEPDGDSDLESTITLRVPEPKLDDALTRIATVGRERQRSTSTEDVTATIADLDSRVESQTRSVARVRDLLARAKTLPDVVLLESELARREADLESVQARQRALADKALLATVTVVLRRPVAGADTADEAGFLAGLGAGWTALKAGTTAVLTVLGAVLPLAVALGLIGVPAALIRRRYQAYTAAPTPPPAAPVGPSQPLPTP